MSNDWEEGKKGHDFMFHRYVIVKLGRFSFGQLLHFALVSPHHYTRVSHQNAVQAIKPSIRLPEKTTQSHTSLHCIRPKI